MIRQLKILKKNTKLKFEEICKNKLMLQIIIGVTADTLLQLKAISFLSTLLCVMEATVLYITYFTDLYMSIKV